MNPQTQDNSPKWAYAEDVYWEELPVEAPQPPAPAPAAIVWQVERKKFRRSQAARRAGQFGAALVLYGMMKFGQGVYVLWQVLSAFVLSVCTGIGQALSDTARYYGQENRTSYPDTDFQFGQKSRTSRPDNTHSRTRTSHQDALEVDVRVSVKNRTR